jgi:hypothetical protein
MEWGACVVGMKTTVTVSNYYRYSVEELPLQPSNYRCSVELLPLQCLLLCEETTMLELSVGFHYTQDYVEKTRKNSRKILGFGAHAAKMSPSKKQA